MRQNNDWFISSLSLRNFRGSTDFSIDFGHEVTLLIGENGTGKTGVLDAASILLSTVVKELGGEPRGFLTSDARVTTDDPDSRERTATEEVHYPVEGRLHAVIDGHEFTWERSLAGPKHRTTWGDRHVREYCRELARAATGDDKEMGAEIGLPVIAHYGVERLLDVRRAQGEITASRTDAYLSALDPRSDVKRLSRFVRSLDLQILSAKAHGDEVPGAAERQFEAIDRACASILEPVGWSRLRWNHQLEYLTLSHPVHGTHPLDRMSAGTKIAAGLAIDLASRMARANPAVGADELLETTPGIALVDEVDLHLHPTWQQKIVPALRATFPRVQFILTTHSPQVISTVEGRNIRILTDDAVSTPRHAEGLRANVILDEIQGVNPAPDVPLRALLKEYLDLGLRGRGRISSCAAAAEARRRADGRAGEE